MSKSKLAHAGKLWALKKKVDALNRIIVRATMKRDRTMARIARLLS